MILSGRKLDTLSSFITYDTWGREKTFILISQVEPFHEPYKAPISTLHFRTSEPRLRATRTLTPYMNYIEMTLFHMTQHMARPSTFSIYALWGGHIPPSPVETPIRSSSRKYNLPCPSCLSWSFSCPHLIEKGTEVLCSGQSISISPIGTLDLLCFMGVSLYLWNPMALGTKWREASTNSPKNSCFQKFYPFSYSDNSVDCLI